MLESLPQFPVSVRLTLADPNFTLLVRLKVSQRKSSRFSSFSVMLRASEKFSLNPGQLRSFGLNLVSLPKAVVGCAPKNDGARYAPATNCRCAVAPAGAWRFSFREWISTKWCVLN